MSTVLMIVAAGLRFIDKPPNAHHFLFLLTRRDGALLCPTHHNAYIFVRPMQGSVLWNRNYGGRKSSAHRYPGAEHHRPIAIAIISRHDHHRDTQKAPAVWHSPRR
ncbi:MAG TPA: hypothetical protein VKC66_06885 [Xanthobacteraceae bacterium]|nr:hypothetical protein [Xanthobacteraceae bacterium]